MTRLEFLKQVPLFADLSDPELTDLAKDLARREFKHDESIFQQGDPGEALYVIEEGQVRIFVHGSDGQETSVVHYGPGDIFGELSAIDGLPRSASAVAMEDTSVFCLSQDRFLEHMRRSPKLNFNFLQVLSGRVRGTTKQIDNLAWLTVRRRLARKLLDLAQQHGQVKRDGVRINLAFTQTELARMIGTTRESINKSLRDFRQEGWIRVERGRVTIVDPDKLREISS